MTNDKITVTDAITGETVERLMNDEEQAARNLLLDGLKSQEQAAQAEAEANATAQAALLAKLGITADEAALLLS